MQIVRSGSLESIRDFVGSEFQRGGVRAEGNPRRVSGSLGHGWGGEKQDREEKASNQGNGRTLSSALCQSAAKGISRSAMQFLVSDHGAEND